MRSWRRLHDADKLIKPIASPLDALRAANRERMLSTLVFPLNSL